VPEPVHYLGDAADACRLGAREVTEVMNPNIIAANGLREVLGEHRVVEVIRVTQRREHERVRLFVDVARQVLLEILADVWWHHDRAGLAALGHVYPASLAPVTGRPRHHDHLGTLADVLAPQLDHFAPADTAPRGQQNKRFHAIGLDCVG